MEEEDEEVSKEFEFGEVTLKIQNDGPILLSGSITVREPAGEPAEVRLQFEMPLRGVPGSEPGGRELFALRALRRLLAP